MAFSPPKPLACRVLPHIILTYPCAASWAAMLYLTLFICSKFAIAIPFLPAKLPKSRVNAQGTVLPLHKPSTAGHDQEQALFPSDQGSPSSNARLKVSGDEQLPSTLAPYSDESVDPLRNSAASPPNWVLVLALIPVGGAIYITASRYADFRHHGFDVLFGSLIGIVCAYFSFRWYHLPIRRGAGWAWGARSKGRAFGIGVGVGGYVGDEGW